MIGPADTVFERRADECQKICKVAFAFNSKKLRKSSFSDSDTCSSTTVAPSSSSLSCWRGGSLADILSHEVIEGVQFFAFGSGEGQPPYDLIIHKLTEDLERGC